MVPICAVKAEPERPAMMIEVIRMPISRRIEMPSRLTTNSSRAELAKLVRPLIGQDDSDQERQQPDDGQGVQAGLLDVVDQGDAAQPPWRCGGARQGRHHHAEEVQQVQRLPPGLERGGAGPLDHGDDGVAGVLDGMVAAPVRLSHRLDQGGMGGAGAGQFNGRPRRTQPRLKAQKQQGAYGIDGLQLAKVQAKALVPLRLHRLQIGAQRLRGRDDPAADGGKRPAVVLRDGFDPSSAIRMKVRHDRSPVCM